MTNTLDNLGRLLFRKAVELNGLKGIFDGGLVTTSWAKLTIFDVVVDWSRTGDDGRGDDVVVVAGVVVDVVL